LPPPVTLPAGYVPRATVPKPKAAKMAAPGSEPTPTPAAPTEPPKRAYFLKPKDVIEAEKKMTAAREARQVKAAAPAPKTELRVGDLPASWQKHIGQDLFPLTGKEGDAVAAELAAELTARGMSRSEALMFVSKNKDLTVQTRQQLMRALSRSKVKGS